MLTIQKWKGEFEMKNWKNIVKKVVAVMLLAGILFTVPYTGGEPGIMPCLEPEIEHNPYI